MSAVAIFILFDSILGLAAMENRPDLNPGVSEYWVYPGGKVETGELPVEAMLRECAEEFGIVPINYRLLTETELRIHPRPGTTHEKDVGGWRSIPFVVFEWSGKVPSHTIEENHAQIHWISPLTLARKQPDGFTCNVEIARELCTQLIHV